MRALLVIIFGTTLFLPASASASVIINEIAWMGSVTSANHEWIELYNSGDTAINVEGWTLSDGLNLSISLSGTLGPTSYAVLERTSDDSAPGAAFLIYTGALVNTGATLTLQRGDGSIADQVAGGENWGQIGGDNSTKETAQYTSAGWVTDVATPGAINAPGRVTPPTEEEDVTVKNLIVSNSGSKKKVSETAPLEVVKTGLKMTPKVRTVAYVNQEIPFEVEATGLGKNILSSLKYTWNFGDSYVAFGQKVKHSYSYPGKYVVTLNGKSYEDEATTRNEIIVLPVTFSLSEDKNGDIQINNDAPYDIDISGYQIIGIGRVIMPPLTILLPKGTLTIKRERLETVRGSSVIAFYDGQQNQLTTLNGKKEMEGFGGVGAPTGAEAKLPPPLAQTAFTPLSEPESSSGEFTFLSKQSESKGVDEFEDEALFVPEDFATEESVLVGERKSTKSDNKFVYLLFIGLLFFAFVGILYGKGKPE